MKKIFAKFLLFGDISSLTDEQRVLIMEAAEAAEKNFILEGDKILSQETTLKNISKKEHVNRNKKPPGA